MWEFDATFDYRVCDQCYPHDGKRSKDRSNLPSVPRHPNCRCRILPLTATALALEKDDLKDGMEMSIVEVNKKPRLAKGRVYKTKARVGKQKMTKSAREVQLKKGERPTMARFMSEASTDTQNAVLGKVRANEFYWLTKDPQGPKVDITDGLRRVTVGDAEAFAKAQRGRKRARRS